MKTSEEIPHRHTNRLIDETSPYLLQHAHNPVDWYPWEPEALDRARRENKLILLSIGYSACHWCHVMERESFEDTGIAGLMNENFINIKVDREERPDLDEIYMTATVAMNRGQGGWPMTLFLTPEMEPVFAGTYFPPTDMYGRPGFPTLLRQVARAWREDPEGLRRRAGEFAERLRQSKSVGPPLAIGESELRSAIEDYADDFDPRYGGFGHAPKFPPAVGIQLLLRLHQRFGDTRALDMATRTLDGMARGGMYDHVGGGFCRYSTDQRWLVPHFEKMLYDNALLAKSYLEGWQATGEELFRRTATEVLDYVLREMTAPEGGFYSSTDAESEGEEGKFFVWTPEQLVEILEDEEAVRRVSAYYDITPTGNWEGVSIPHTPRPLQEVARELRIRPEDLRSSVDAARAKLYAAREKRVKPGLDDKVLTGWNGLMIGAMAEGGRVLRDRRYLQAAERAAEFVLETLSREDGGLLRTYRAGKAHLNAYMEDYAYLAEGLLDLYEAGGRIRWLRETERLLQRALAEFLDEGSGAFYSTAREHEELLMRYRDGGDGATPAPNATAAHTLARLSHHLDRPDMRHAAIRAIKAYGSMISRYPRGFAKSLCVADFLLTGPVELAFVGPRGSRDLESLLTETAKRFLPNRIVGLLDPSQAAGAEELPLLRGKTTVDGKAALYVCRDFACRAPVTEPAEVAEQLSTTSASEGVTTIAVRLPGQATAEGTRRYAIRSDRIGYRPFGFSGLTTSTLGFGGYRVHDHSSEHRAALQEALASGINLIDTSTNYLDGGSERLIGSVLSDRIDAGALKRDEIIVVSKIGYVQGANLMLARDREEAGEPFPEMVKYEEELWHCIHPDFLADQLRRSLDRLELQTLDFCLLHNPEYFLSDAARRGVPLEEARETFYGRLERAFEHLERKVTEGRLSGYGVSSNTVVSPAEDADATSLARMLEAARKTAGDDHHFRVLQLPLNLLEAGAALERNDGPDGRSTVLEVARESSIAVLANRPLNALAGNSLVRLADVPVEETDVSFEEQLGRVADLEMAFRAEIAPKLKAAEGSLDPGDYFRMAERLKEVRRVMPGWAYWSQIEAQINYTIVTIVGALDRQLDGESGVRWSEWRDGYLPELQELMRELRAVASERTLVRNEEITRIIDPFLPEERRRETLSRKALWVVISTSGVTAALNGMRSPDYVEDSARVLDWPDLGDTTPIYEAIRRARL